MPTTKRKGNKTTTNTANDNDDDDNNNNNKRVPDDVATLPFAQYTSTIAVHTTLLSFIALFLPRTAFLSDLTRPVWDDAKQSSRDKPQNPFLDALTLSPLSTMAWICAGVAMLQVWWGGWARSWHIGIVVGQNYQEGGGEEEGGGGGGGGEGNRRMRRVKMQEQRFEHLKAACLATIAASFIFHVLLVLLGASLTNCSTPFLSGPDCPSDNLHLRTYLLALLLSLLTVPTPAYTTGIPNIFKNDSQSIVLKFLWMRLFAEFSIRNSLERALVYPVIGTLVGSWVGAIPIALDWDRPWQAWPLTSAYGAIAGYIVGSLAGLTVTALDLLANEHLRAVAAAAGDKPQTRLKSKSS